MYKTKRIRILGMTAKQNAIKITTISVKPFLNKHLSPIIDSNRNSTYPLYYQVTFERKNTQIKSYFQKYLPSLQGLEPETLEMIQFEAQILKKVIQYEKQKHREVFQLTGLKAVYEVYIQPVDNEIQRYLKKKLLKAITLTHSEFQNILKFEGFETQFMLLYKASKKLFDNLDRHIDKEFKNEIESYRVFNKCFPVHVAYSANHITLVDWLTSSNHESIQKRINDYNGETKLSRKKIYQTLNSIVNQQYRFRYSKS